MKILHRVIKKHTSSLQPGNGNTYWSTEVLYCGYDREEALRVYYTHKPSERSGSYGNSATRTIKQKKDIDPSLKERVERHRAKQARTSDLATDA